MFYNLRCDFTGFGSRPVSSSHRVFFPRSFTNYNTSVRLYYVIMCTYVTTPWKYFAHNITTCTQRVSEANISLCLIKDKKKNDPCRAPCSGPRFGWIRVVRIVQLLSDSTRLFESKVYRKKKKNV